MAEQQPRDHHYVAQGYMRGFCEQANRLFTYDKVAGRIRISSPKGIAYTRDFYTVDTIDENDSDEIEQALGTIESVAIPIIRKAAVGQVLSNSEIADLAIYMAIQYGRTPHARQQMDRVAEVVYTNKAKAIIAEAINNSDKYNELVENWKQEYPNMKPPTRDRLVKWVLEKGPVYLINVDNGTFVKLFMERAYVIAEGLLKRRWQIWHAPKGASFITSDNPIGLYTSRQLKGNEVLAILMREGIRYFPLNSSSCLVVTDEPYASKFDHRTVSKLQVRKINKLIYDQATKYVISGSKPLLESLS
jgi:hypothetical protein